MLRNTKLTREDALRLRLHAQRLHPDFAASDPHDLAAHLCGLQAQDQPAGTLSFQPRGSGFAAADVDRARNHTRRIVRTWLMRNTLHIVAAEDVRWLLALLSPRSIRSTRRRREQLGLTDPIVERGLGLIVDMLAAGPLTRQDLLAALSGEGIPTEGQAGIHLLARAALAGLICYGPDAGKEHTFVLLDDWLADVPGHEPADPLAALVERYLMAYAPASPHDLAKWAGITVTQARQGFAALAGSLLEVQIAGEAAWLLEGQAGWLDRLDDQLVVRLLPAFDTYLLGWQSRDVILPGAYAKRIHPGGGILHPALLVDGRIVARWRLKRGKRAAISVEPFEPLDSAVLGALEVEAAALGRFLGLDAELVVEGGK